LTISGQLAIGLKYPGWGLIIILASQPFWFYSSWKASKQANQIGLLINTIIFAAVTIFGVLNYWVIGKL
jgi:heme/copper-type cytochrome/quinol oxidase subunit 2